MVRSGLVLCYSLVVTLLAPLLLLAARWNPKLAAQLGGRQPVRAIAAGIARERARRQRCAVFFCSSAGEFEQARPLIDRLARLPSVYVQVIFFSKAGLEYVAARGETLPCCLAPVTDSVWHWGWLFAALRPDVVAVVRHELWPGFLESARHYARLFLIDASRSLGETRSELKRQARAWLLGAFDGIYAATASDVEYFLGYGLPAARVKVAGDTKYDRVKERAAGKTGEVTRLKAALDGLVPAGTPRLVLGSAYRQEVELFLAARADRQRDGAPPWQVVIAPHQIDDGNIGWILDRLAEAGVTATRMTAVAGARAAEVVVVDTMGQLAEIYGTADAAFVGGALHNKVHNVLEPACHGLALAFGPRHENSQEAVQLVREGLVTVVRDAAAMASWWAQLDAQGGELASRMVAAVDAMTGASDRILADWRPLLDG